MFQREAPEITVAVHHVEAPALGDRSGEVLPLAHLPFARRPVLAVGAGQRRNKLDAFGRRRPCRAEHRDVVAALGEAPAQVPDDGLDAAAATTGDGGGEGGDLGYAHEREPTTAQSA